MKLLSIQSLLLASALFAPSLHAQDESAKVREIEQKVLRKQYQSAIDTLVRSAREAEGGETSASPDLIAKRLQWLNLVAAQIEGENKSAADQKQMAESADKLNELAWGMVISPDAGKRHPEIALKLANIAIELAGGKGDLMPNVLDTKARALFLLGKHREAIAEQEKAIAAVTVKEEKAGFEATLADYKKNELPEVPSPADDGQSPNSYGAPPPTAGVAYITNKLRNIVIPVIDFENVTVEEAVDFLRLRTTELDKAELDPARKGLNFVIRRLAASPAPAAGTPPVDKLPDAVADPGTIRIKELRLRNVPLAVALKYICDSARLRYKVDDFAVTLVHVDAPEGLFTRTFRVPPDFSSKLNSGPDAKPAPGDLKARPTIIDLLKSAGINFPEGSSATLTNSGTLMDINTLMVTNTPTELDKIEMLIAVMTPGER